MRPSARNKGICRECGKFGEHSEDCTQYVYADEIGDESERERAMADRLFDRE